MNYTAVLYVLLLFLLTQFDYFTLIETALEANLRMLSMQYKKVAPVGDRIFVKIDSEEEQTSSGILLPSSAQKKPTQGEVVDIGDAKAVRVSYPLLCQRILRDTAG